MSRQKKSIKKKNHPEWSGKLHWLIKHPRTSSFQLKRIYKTLWKGAHKTVKQLHIQHLFKQNSICRWCESAICPGFMHFSENLSRSEFKHVEQTLGVYPVLKWRDEIMIYAWQFWVLFFWGFSSIWWGINYVWWSMKSFIAHPHNHKFVFFLTMNISSQVILHTWNGINNLQT